MSKSKLEAGGGGAPAALQVLVRELSQLYRPPPLAPRSPPCLLPPCILHFGQAGAKQSLAAISAKATDVQILYNALHTTSSIAMRTPSAGTYRTCKLQMCLLMKVSVHSINTCVVHIQVGGSQPLHMQEPV